MIASTISGTRQYSVSEALLFSEPLAARMTMRGAAANEMAQLTRVKTQFAQVSSTTSTFTSSGRAVTVFPDSVLFQHLVSEWRKERGATSSITKMAMCPSYQRIIAMGERAVPLILRELEQEGDEPDMWFWALQILASADPVGPEAQGDIIAMAKAWLNWGRKRYAW